MNTPRLITNAKGAFITAPVKVRTHTTPGGLIRKTRVDAAPRTNGKVLESLIERSAVGVRLIKVDQAAKKIMRSGQFTVVAQRGPCDFFGTIIQSGRSIVIDAKESREKHRLVTSEDHLPKHQRRYMLEHGSVGALAGIIVLAHEHDRLFWCDWRLLMREQSMRSVPFEWMTDIGPASASVDWKRVQIASALAATRA